MEAKMIHTLIMAQFDYFKDLYALSGSDGIVNVESWRIDMYNYVIRRCLEHADTFR